VHSFLVDLVEGLLFSGASVAICAARYPELKARLTLLATPRRAIAEASSPLNYAPTARS
jgi:hypothetical protein